jgi:hypothetical protein
MPFDIREYSACLHVNFVGGKPVPRCVYTTLIVARALGEKNICQCLNSQKTNLHRVRISPHIQRQSQSTESRRAVISAQQTRGVILLSMQSSSSQPFARPPNERTNVKIDFTDLWPQWQRA